MSTSVYNEEQYKNHLQQIKPDGYLMNSDGQFLKNDSANNRTIMLSFGIREHFPLGVYFFALQMGVCFHQVEEILHEVRQDHPDLTWGHSLDANTFSRGFAKRVLGANTIDNVVSEILVEDDASFAQVQPYLQQMLDAALGFLDTNQTLQQFYDLGEAMPPTENAKFYSSPAPPRRLVVRKLVGLDYEALATQYVIGYNQINRIEDANYILALKNYLDNL